MTARKLLSLTDFRDGGYLQEINRLLLHRLGLALQISYEGEQPIELSVWDAREEPDGIIFANAEIDPLFREKAEKVDRELLGRDNVRLAALGFRVQPIYPKGHAAAPLSCHKTEIKTDLPSLLGSVARAWKLPAPERLARPEHAASLGSYLIQCPGLHVAWDLYLLSAIHLRDIEGAPPANKKEPESTHEFVVLAIDPSPGPLDPAALVEPNSYKPLLPINVCVQLKLGGEETDAIAVTILDGLARCVVAGVLLVEPEGFMGARPLWQDMIRNTAQHLTQGFCPGSVTEAPEREN